MTAPEPYLPLPADHPSVRDRTLCPCCEQPFVAGAVTCLWPVRGVEPALSTGEEQDSGGGACEARLLHHECAVRVAASITTLVAGKLAANPVATLAPSDPFDRFAPPVSKSGIWSGEPCALCQQSISPRDAMAFFPFGPESDSTYVTLPTHAACAELVDRERLRSAGAPYYRVASVDEDEMDRDLLFLINELREALAIYECDAHNWRRYALRLESGQTPGPRPGGFDPAQESRRLDFLEQRIRACGPDLGYLLGLAQGWTNLRLAIDRALAAPRA